MDCKEEILQLAGQNYYRNNFFNYTEFKKDLYNLFIVRKMINRFIKTGIVNEKLLLNNIVISINVFGINQINSIFELLLSKEELGVIKSILIFLNCYRSNYDVKSNRIFDDLLKDITNRYHLGDSP